MNFRHEGVATVLYCTVPQSPIFQISTKKEIKYYVRRYRLEEEGEIEREKKKKKISKNIYAHQKKIQL